MNAHEFCTNLETALDSDPGSITPDQLLSSIPSWDSLAVVSFLAMADSKYGKKVSPGGLKNCKKVEDLIQLIASA